MHLVRLAAGKWNVYAVCTGEDECPLLDFIMGELDEKRGHKVLSKLQQYVPISEPRDWIAGEFSTDLGREILEFRWPKRGGTPRVLWFYDRDRVIVCTHGVLKKKDQLDPAEVDRAVAVRDQYLRDRDAGELTIETIEEFMADGEEHAQ
jgi:phage-related protein